MRAFLIAYAYDLLGASICDPPSNHGSTTAHGVMVHKYLKRVKHTIEMASHKTLEPKRVPDPRGVSWWKDACSVAHTLAQTTWARPERR